jgi:hypothetical protein
MNKNSLKSFCALRAALAVFAVTSHSQGNKESASAHKIVHFGLAKGETIVQVHGGDRSK